MEKTSNRDDYFIVGDFLSFSSISNKFWCLEAIVIARKSRDYSLGTIFDMIRKSNFRVYEVLKTENTVKKYSRLQKLKANYESYLLCLDLSCSE